MALLSALGGTVLGTGRAPSHLLSSAEGPVSVSIPIVLINLLALPPTVSNDLQKGFRSPVFPIVF
jgi:hypothetical protein